MCIHTHKQNISQQSNILKYQPGTIKFVIYIVVANKQPYFDKIITLQPIDQTMVKRVKSPRQEINVSKYSYSETLNKQKSSNIVRQVDPSPGNNHGSA